MVAQCSVSVHWWWRHCDSLTDMWGHNDEDLHGELWTQCGHPVAYAKWRRAWWHNGEDVVAQWGHVVAHCRDVTAHLWRCGGFLVEM